MSIGAFDRRQYVLIVRLLRTLGARRELTSQFGMHGPALGILAALLVLLGGFPALVALTGRVTPRDVLMLSQTMTLVLLVPLLIAEAADALLNPAEAAVLAHRPIGNLTYVAAKLTYLIGFAVVVGLALNALPALAGLRLEGTSRFYPLTHLAAAALGAAFTALATCGALGVLFRMVPAARVRNAALWAQLLGGLSLPALPHVLNLIDADIRFDGPYWSALPVSWFAALGLAGQGGSALFVPAFALPGMVLSAGLVLAGLGVLTQGYMIRTSTTRRAAGTTTSVRRSRLAMRLLERLTGSRAGAGSGLFVMKMARRDWQVRRTLLQAVVPLLLVVLTARGGLRSPFEEDGSFATHLLPHIFGIAMIAAADALAFSDHYRARWIFLTVPASGLRGVVRGTLATLWLSGAAIPSVVVLIVATAAWGVEHGGLYAAYTLAVLSCYLGVFGWAQRGLPFTRQADAKRTIGNASVVFLCIILGVAAAIVQVVWLFRDVGRVAIASLVLGATAVIAGRTSLRILENKALSLLAAFSGRDRRTFTVALDEAEDDDLA